MKKMIYRYIASVMASLMIAVPCSPVLNAQTVESTGMSQDQYILNMGSVSKVYTVAAVMQLADRGLIDIDAPVTDYIPDFTMEDPRYTEITVRMLMNHTSGLMGSVYSDCFRFGELSGDYHDTFLSILSSERLKADPGTYNCYCNDGFTLLEILVERVSGMTFADYLSENICAPLGLNNTGTMRRTDDMERQIPIYINGDQRIPAECPQLIGCGGISADSRDMCVFGSAFFLGNETILSDEAKLLMGEDNTTAVTEAFLTYGLGWDNVSVPDYEACGVTLWTKGGDTYFQHGFLAVAPEEQISISVLSSGGGSGICQDLAYDLLDIVLEEHGIDVTHPEEELKETVDYIPEEYLSYEGLYTDSQNVVRISFPDMHYMLIETVTSDQGFSGQYMLTAEGDFVRMTGDIESGNAIEESPVNTLLFEQAEGEVYVSENGSSYVLQKLPENAVSGEAQDAWDQRNDINYYLVSSTYNDMSYLQMPSYTVHTSPDAPGYANGCTITDDNNAVNAISLPGMASRDITDLRIINEDDNEYLCLTSQGFTYISENDIDTFYADMSSVTLQDGHATWYRIEGLTDTAVTFDIPENASVYVYDQRGNVLYTSFMCDYGNTVPLPSYGMIVFIGDDGAQIGIRR